MGKDLAWDLLKYDHVAMSWIATGLHNIKQEYKTF